MGRKGVLCDERGKGSGVRGFAATSVGGRML
jgi:hypothetical protein